VRILGTLVLTAHNEEKPAGRRCFHCFVQNDLLSGKTYLLTFERMNTVKPFSTLAVVIFSIISLAHLLRLFFQWEVVVNGVIVPQWVSVPAFVILGALAFMLWREAQGEHRGR